MTGQEKPTGRYLPVSEHGMIGDLRTAALVGTDGRIDWFCCPRFDSPSVFGSLLDADKGGYWELIPVGDVVTRNQFYIPDSNILITRFATYDGIVEVQDFMPIVREHDEQHQQRLVRRVVNVRGSVRMSLRLAPRPNYARDEHHAELFDRGARFTAPGLNLELDTTVPIELDGADGVAEFDIADCDTELFVLEVFAEGQQPDGAEDRTEELLDADRLFNATTLFWRQWLTKSRYTGRWRETVHRSALTLKMLTHEPSGAIIAAPTLGLPEQVGGERNWDYRYVWIRDAAFSLYALLRMGFTDEAQGFIGWLADRFREPMDGALGPLRVMYSIDGEQPPVEHELDHLEGYRGSRPVRVGNGAAGQLQLDIYGELIDSIYLFNKYGTQISHDTWQNLCTVLDWLLDNWDLEDEGIWETRGGRKKHTFSRLMSWVAIERMVRMARQRGLPADLARWTGVRDEIYHQLMESAWNTEREAFVQHFDSAEDPQAVLDASLLLMPMVKFCSPRDPRFLSTMDAIEQNLVVDSLVFRYDPVASPDGLRGDEGTFSICSFWYVEALARTERLDDARLALEKMFTYANHVGLYAEEIGLTGEQLGNFPQAFTHLSLISSAVNLDRALG